MGHANSQLIRDCERARKLGDEDDLARLSTLIDASQAVCPHPLRDRRIREFTRRSTTGKYRKGHLYMGCRRCSKIIEYEP